MEKKNSKRRTFWPLLLLLLLFALFFGAILLLRGCLLTPSKVAKVSVKRMPNSHYQLYVGKEPYLIRGVCYQPIPIGENYDYNFWGDPNKAWLVDGKLMKEAGINTLRFYRPGQDPNQVRQLLDDMYQQFGIRVIMGHTLGIYDTPPPDYADENFRETMKEDVLNMVKEYKDEPGILMWLLGNENNYSFDDQISPWSSTELDKIDDPSERARQKARIYYSFINDIAKEIHKIDPAHPVVMGNGETFYLEIAKEVAPEVDILGGIFYRGPTFGNIWQQIESKFGKPVVLIEFGCDRYNAKTNKEDEDIQAKFLTWQWRDIIHNTCGKTGRGNCLGGCVFEWSDEWWKHDASNPPSWFVQEEYASWSNGAYYFDIEVDGHMNINEEWFGIVGLSPEKENGVNKRVPKKAYYTLKDLWMKGCEDVQPRRGIKIQ